jgi:FMN phosphatase YigB (HAD superfamily)
MQSEYPNFLLSEQEKIALKETLKKNGVKALLCDLDDTLLDTHRGFVQRIRDYSCTISELCNSEAEAIYSTFSVVQAQLRSHFGVSPLLLSESARITAYTYGVNFYEDPIRYSVDKLLGVYTEEVPPVFEGIKETLKEIINLGLDTYIVTHGAYAYSKRKIDANGLAGYFKDIYTVDDRGQKNSKAWKDALMTFGCLSHEVLVVGDNWETDIRATFEANVPTNQLFRIKTHFTKNTHRLVDGVCELNHFNTLPKILASQFLKSSL